MPVLKPVPDAAAGLALEAGLLSAEETGVVLWSAMSEGLVCPTAYTRRSGFDEAARRSAERGWPVSHRPTGGGIVPQGPGVLNLAVAFTAGPGFTIEDGYRLITRPIRSCLATNGLATTTGATAGSFCDGKWNLSVAGRKVVGTAQRWRALPDGTTRILAHALILVRGTVERGAAAVAAIHRDLGLAGDIRADAHTTLEEMFGFDPSAMDHLATRLHAVVRRELDDIGSPEKERTAA